MPRDLSEERLEVLQAVRRGWHGQGIASAGEVAADLGRDVEEVQADLDWLDREGYLAATPTGFEGGETRVTYGLSPDGEEALQDRGHGGA